MKKFLVAIVCLVLILSVAIAEGGDAIVLHRGMYVVGTDIEPGSYTLYYDENDPVWLNSDFYTNERSIYPSFSVNLYKDMDTYLKKSEDGNSGQVISVNSLMGLFPHVTLVDGMVIFIEMHELEFAYFKPDK